MEVIETKPRIDTSKNVRITVINADFIVRVRVDSEGAGFEVF